MPRWYITTYKTVVNIIEISIAHSCDEIVEIPPESELHYGLSELMHNKNCECIFSYARRYEMKIARQENSNK